LCALSPRSRQWDDERAYAQLRSLAMIWQVSVEQAARRIVAMTEEGDEHSSHA
jgi:AmiR/NasT family two-component response regulator